MKTFLLPNPNYSTNAKVKDDEIVLLSLPVTAVGSATAGLPVASRTPTTTPGPQARGLGQFTPKPHLLSGVPPRQEGRPARCQRARPASRSARAQHRPGPVGGGVVPAAQTPGPRAAPLASRPNLRRHPGTGLSSPGPPYLVMAQSEVHGRHAGDSSRNEHGCDRRDLAPSPQSPRPKEKLSGSPSPRGSDHSLSRAGTRAASRSCLAPTPTTSPERRPPAPAPGW